MKMSKFNPVLEKSIHTTYGEKYFIEQKYNTHLILSNMFPGDIIIFNDNLSPEEFYYYHLRSKVPNETQL